MFFEEQVLIASWFFQSSLIGLKFMVFMQIIIIV